MIDDVVTKTSCYNKFFWGGTEKYRMFQKELYNFESLYKFIQEDIHSLLTVIM
jgi:hypothetical protein